MAGRAIGSARHPRHTDAGPTCTGPRVQATLSRALVSAEDISVA
ncbi:hypothetical protein BJY27_003763 [Streptomyces rapamycinicus]|uniref:Uncharacterized protein n=2 Tax=Streptomyces rapamycinicus TaxID=1226757 RepID=A0A3L8RQF5_STRRN|nr:hypothetical protein [Streptomyces rapamycinicus]RLV81718.1 hypothetical protein D3C57_125075 [Streptomyces rapamycinicus NRRL 5491]